MYLPKLNSLVRKLPFESVSITRTACPPPRAFTRNLNPLKAIPNINRRLLRCRVNINRSRNMIVIYSGTEPKLRPPLIGHDHSSKP